ncbi:unnamed protein product, partial [Prorocentrum cordatum]
VGAKTATTPVARRSGATRSTAWRVATLALAAPRAFGTRALTSSVASTPPAASTRACCRGRRRSQTECRVAILLPATTCRAHRVPSAQWRLPRGRAPSASASTT